MQPTGKDSGIAGTFQQLWATSVRQHADHVFLVFSDDAGTTEWTYREFDDVVGRVAGRLAAGGVDSGTAVHVALRNCPAFVALWLASARLGAWLVPVDPASTRRDLQNQLARTTPAFGVFGPTAAEAYRDAAATAGIASLEIEESVLDVRTGSSLLGDGVQARPVSPGDRLAVMFTSGTTSQPKGVMLTQQNYWYVGRVMAELSDLHEDDRFYVSLPLFHANAQYYCFAPAIAMGASVALTARFSASRWVAEAAALGVTHASLFAAPIRMILARTSGPPTGHRLKHVWFAQSLGHSHYQEFAALVGCEPRQLYGMTETLAVVTADLSEAPSAESIGTPVAGRTVRLLDVDGSRVVPDGFPGVITVAGEPGEDIFAGYLDDPDTTARTIRKRDGRSWLSTGDLARVREDGQLVFVGRVDDVIKVAGENVSLTEVEAALAQAPGVLEVAVLARPDEVRDHVPVAFVVLRHSAVAPPTTAELDAWAAQVLPPQSRPREWTIVEELPRTSVGKIKRFALAERLNLPGLARRVDIGEAGANCRPIA